MLCRTWTVLLVLAEATDLPSGDQMMPLTQPRLQEIQRGLPVAAFQTCTDLSKPTDAIYLLLGDQVIAVTLRTWPIYVNSVLPVVALQTCTVVSRPAEASSLPSGDQAMAVTQLA